MPYAIIKTELLGYKLSAIITEDYEIRPLPFYPASCIYKDLCHIRNKVVMWTFI